MNKKIKIISLFLCFAMLGSVFAGCGPEKQSNTNKLHQVNVSVYEGGYGYQWAIDLADEYNKTVLAYSDYEINIVPQKRLPDSIITELASGSEEYQLYINAGNELRKGIESGYFEDLSDILSAKVDGESGGTIRDKVQNYDQWESIFSKSGQGCYALPYSCGFEGFVIDHQEFIDREYYDFASSTDASDLAAQGISYTEDGGKLKFVSSTSQVNYKQGDFILSKGKDGKFGTYDDGQPITLAEFDALVKKIGQNVFIWGGGVDEYLNAIFDAIFAQYEGMEDYEVYYNYDSQGRQIEFFDGSSNTISLENGYEVTKMAGLKVAYEFFEKYFDYNNKSISQYMHPLCQNTAASQFDGQSYYLRGYRNTERNPQSAMLIDGNWWEHEATTAFNELSKVSRGYGDREYRFLLLPDFEGQKNDKTCFSVTATGTMSIGKDSNAERLAITKDFLKFVLRDESLRMITRTTGDVLGYYYTLTESDKEQMTPFQRNVWDIYYDTENIEIVSRKLEGIKSPLSFASDFGYQRYYLPEINGVFPFNTLKAAINNDLQTILDGLKNAYTETAWQSYVNQAKRQGFFQEA